MLILGLTGGMGSGKGYCSEIFAEYGIMAIDTDKVSRNVVQKGKPCLDELAASFGSSILDENGELIRKNLAALAFESTEKTELLNSITHKYILEECKDFIREREANGDFACIIDAPLLFESKFNCICDYTVCVLSDLPTRLHRVFLRDGISAQDAMKRIEKQHTNEFFRASCDFSIYNSDGDDPRAQIGIIVQQLKMRA